jgi:hypothetical protein
MLEPFTKFAKTQDVKAIQRPKCRVTGLSYIWSAGNIAHSGGSNDFAITFNLRSHFLHLLLAWFLRTCRADDPAALVRIRRGREELTASRVECSEVRVIGLKSVFVHLPAMNLPIKDAIISGVVQL